MSETPLSPDELRALLAGLKAEGMAKFEPMAPREFIAALRPEPARPGEPPFEEMGESSRLFYAAQLGPGEVGVGEADVGQVGGGEVGAGEVRAGQVGPGQVGTREVCTAQIGTRQHRVRQVWSG